MRRSERNKKLSVWKYTEAKQQQNRVKQRDENTTDLGPCICSVWVITNDKTYQLHDSLVLYIYTFSSDLAGSAIYCAGLAQTKLRTSNKP